MYEITLYLITIAVFFCLVRFVKGPTAPDRVLVLDTMSSLVVVIIALLSVYYGNPMLIDIAIVYALLSFIGNLAISKYLMGKKIHEELL